MNAVVQQPQPLMGSVASVALREIERELRVVYRSERTTKSAWRIGRVIEGLRSVGAETTADLTVPTVSLFKATLAGKSPRTMLTYLSTTRTVAKYLVDTGRLMCNPFNAFDFFKFAKKPLRKGKTHLNLEEIRRVFAELKAQRFEDWKAHRLFALFATAALLGMRKSEILRLQVRDIDLDQETLAIVRRERLKTEASEAILPLPRELVEVLSEWVPRTGSEWLFPNASRTGYWREGSPGKKPLDALREAGKRCGVEGVGFSALRHAWATHAQLAWGLSRAQIKAFLRHTTEETQDWYQHADLPDFRRAASSVRIFEPGEARGEVA